MFFHVCHSRSCTSKNGSTFDISTINSLHFYIFLKVNLDAATREKTRRNVECGSPSCFDEAQKMIYNLMEKDSYRRFLKSKLIQDMCQKENCIAHEKKGCDWADGRQVLVSGA